MVINIGRSIRWLAAVMLMLTVILAAFLENITAMIIIGALTLSLERRLEIDLSEMICYERYLHEYRRTDAPDKFNPKPSSCRWL